MRVAMACRLTPSRHTSRTGQRFSHDIRNGAGQLWSLSLVFGADTRTDHWCLSSRDRPEARTAGSIVLEAGSRDQVRSQ